MYYFNLEILINILISRMAMENQSKMTKYYNQHICMGKILEWHFS